MATILFMFIIFPCHCAVYMYKIMILQKPLGGGRVGEGAVYLTSLGRPTDIGLQLGKACYPCSG